MASPLTVTTNVAAATGAKGLNARASAGAETGDAVMNTFAALLGAASQTVTPPSADTSAELGFGNLVDLSFGAGFGSEEGDKAEDPDAIAAVIDVALPIQPVIVDAKPVLTELVDSLGELKLSLEAGETVDPALLKRIDAALEDLAAKFDVDLAALPSLDDLKALATAVLPEDVSIEAQLTTALAPLAETLLSGKADMSADIELSAQIKAIGEKLAALLQGLNSGDIEPDKLAALGLNADTAADADLEAAIAKLVNPPVKIETSATVQVLATPTLKLTEPVLTGKAAVETTAGTAPSKDTIETPEPALKIAPVSGDDTDTGGTGNGKADDTSKPVEAKASVTVAVATAVETQPDLQASTQPTQVASRIDAAAARPVVQPGYQTSQQQLNLPQLAFELVRQVNDGNTRFQMRLDPPELGRIDVRLDIDSTGGVNARLIVEKAETLDLMQRDQRGLEKALQQAGLDSAKTNLEFSLKQNSGGQQGQDGNGRQALFGAKATAEAEEPPPPTINLYRGSLTASGVNIIA